MRYRNFQSVFMHETTDGFSISEDGTVINGVTSFTAPSVALASRWDSTTFFWTKENVARHPHDCQLFYRGLAPIKALRTLTSTDLRKSEHYHVNAVLQGKSPTHTCFLEDGHSPATNQQTVAEDPNEIPIYIYDGFIDRMHKIHDIAIWTAAIDKTGYRQYVSDEQRELFQTRVKNQLAYDGLLIHNSLGMAGSSYNPYNPVKEMPTDAQPVGRILLDSDQVRKFAEAPEPPPREFLVDLVPPYYHFFLEFTEPILIGEQTILSESSSAIKLGNDYLRAIIYRSSSSADCGASILAIFEDDGGLLTYLAFRHTGATSQALLNLSQTLHMPGCLPDEAVNDNTEWPEEFIGVGEDADTERWIPACHTSLKLPQGVRKFMDALESGHPQTTKGMMGDIALGPDGLYHFPERHYGTTERNANRLAILVSWLLTYMTAKGIVLEEKPVSRAERRRTERAQEKGESLPEPWHIVNVEPRTAYWTGRNSGERGESYGKHSYRYIVRGHLRLGKHKLKDGSYRRTREWIKPHERGLANTTFIPNISSYKGDMDEKFIPDMMEVD